MLEYPRPKNGGDCLVNMMGASQNYQSVGFSEHPLAHSRFLPRLLAPLEASGGQVASSLRSGTPTWHADRVGGQLLQCGRREVVMGPCVVGWVLGGVLRGRKDVGAAARAEH